MINNESLDIFKRFIDSIPDNELILLKENYDKAFSNYWSSKNNPPKFQPIRLCEFRERLKEIWFFKKHG